MIDHPHKAPSDYGITVEGYIAADLRERYVALLTDAMRAYDPVTATHETSDGIGYSVGDVLLWDGGYWVCIEVDGNRAKLQRISRTPSPPRVLDNRRASRYLSFIKPNL